MDEFVNISRLGVNLLLQIYEDDSLLISMILNAQAEHDTATLIDIMRAIREVLDDEIAKLKEWKNNHKNEENETERSI